MKRTFFYSATFGKVRDFYLALAVSMNSIDFKKFFNPVEREDICILEAHKRFSAVANLYRKRLSVFFKTDKNKPGFLVFNILTKLPGFDSPEQSIIYLKSIPYETMMVDLLRFYDKKFAREFYSQLIREKELLLSYLQMLNLDEDIKSGLLLFADRSDAILATLFEFLNMFLPVFEREYTKCFEITAAMTNEIKSFSSDELDQILDNLWFFNDYIGPVDNVCFCHVLFFPKSSQYMLSKGVAYITFGYKCELKKEGLSERPGPTDIFKPFSNRAKLRIIEYLSDSKKRSVSEIAQALNIPVPTMSHYLVSMNKADILHGSKEGRKNLYYICSGYLDKTNDYFNGLSTLF